MPASVTPACGLHLNVPHEVYRRWEAVNQSALKKPTMAQVRYALDEPGEETPALVFGAALHAAIFEPSSFGDRFAIGIEADRRTKDGREWWAAFAAGAVNKTFISAADAVKMGPMVESIRQHKAARMLIESPGQCEVSALWRDTETDVLCKARIDRLLSDLPVIVDLKTTTDLDEHALSRTIATYGYHRQAAWYIDALAACGRIVEKCYLIFVSKDRNAKRRFDAMPSHEVAVKEIGRMDIEYGRKQNRESLAKYAICQRTGDWPSYPETIETIGLPDWAINGDVEVSL